MSLKYSSDFAQETMENKIWGLQDEVKVYIDDIVSFSDDWEPHMHLALKSQKESRSRV